jgi:hypothetical protein
MKGIPFPLMGEGEALHRVGCRTKALNLIWFRGGGDLRYFLRNEVESNGSMIPQKLASG